MKAKKLTLQAVRRFIFILMTLSGFALQFTFLPMMGLKFPVFILIPLTVAFSMYEREFSGFFFGILCGALWDLSSSLADGTLTLLFAVFSFAVGLLTHYVLRNTLSNAIILTFFGSTVYSLIMELFSGKVFSYYPFRDIFISKYLPAIIISTALSVPVYILVRKLSVKFRADKISV